MEEVVRGNNGIFDDLNPEDKEDDKAEKEEVQRDQANPFNEYDKYKIFKLQVIYNINDLPEKTTTDQNKLLHLTTRNEQLYRKYKFDKDSNIIEEEKKDDKKEEKQEPADDVV